MANLTVRQRQLATLTAQRTRNQNTIAGQAEIAGFVQFCKNQVPSYFTTTASMEVMNAILDRANLTTSEIARMTAKNLELTNVIDDLQTI